jgi:hypothetical protein
MTNFLPDSSGRQPLKFLAHMANQDLVWTYEALHDEPLSGPMTGWRPLEGLPQGAAEQVQALCIDPENSFPAVVNGQVCVVIEQEFQSADAGDDWPEAVSQVLERLRRRLLPAVEHALHERGAMVGVVADPAVTVCGRPTLFAALPAGSATVGDVGAALTLVRDFAYPSARGDRGAS